MGIRWTILASMSVVLIVVAGVDGRQVAKKGQGAAGEGMARALASKKLWGKDFAKALATLPQWESVREGRVEVLHDEVVGQMVVEPDRQAAMVAAVNAAGERPTPKPAYAEMLREAAPAGRPALKAQLVERFKDDQKPRLVMTAPGAQFLAPNLDVATVTAELGAPAKKDVRVIPTEGDRRPVTLTEYTYADGSLVFATSDLDPEPEDGDPNKKAVNRAILSVPQATAEVFQRNP